MTSRTTQLFSINDLACLSAEFYGEALHGKNHKAVLTFIRWLDKLVKNEKKTKKTKRK